MTRKKIDLAEFVGNLFAEDDVDVLREGVRVLAQALMDAEVSGQIGAQLHERTPQRTAHRNGYRTRSWDTRVGTVELRVPKVVPGSTSRRCSSPGAAPSARSPRWCRRPT